MKNAWFIILICIIIFLLAIIVMSKDSDTPKKKHDIIYKDDFENGSAEGWEGGIVQRPITHNRSKYALKGINKNKGYIFLEKWKEFPVNENTKLSFAYYCKNVNDLIINCWSTKHNRNYSQTIRNPRQEEWTLVAKNLNELGGDIGSSINSIHISVPNKENAVLIIDEVKLYNE